MLNFIIILVLTHLIGRHREDITKINASRAGETILFRARIQTSRAKSSKLCFFVFRQGVSTIQGILTTDDDKASKQMIKFTSK
jgi:aspartyl-tRNA synthetase